MNRRKKTFWMASLIVVALAFALWIGSQGDFARISSHDDVALNQCVYLKHVVEPIVMMEGLSLTDGGSVGLRFEDTAGTSREVCLMSGWGNYGRDDLVLGSFWPVRENDRRNVPVGSLEERAFLGLLQRWLTVSSKAKSVKAEMGNDTHRFRARSDWKDDPQSRATVYALSILKKLRKRN